MTLKELQALLQETEAAGTPNTNVILRANALPDAVRMLKAVEKRSKAGSWTERIRGGLATDILAILGGER